MVERTIDSVFTSTAVYAEFWQDPAALTLGTALARFLSAKQADCSEKTICSYRQRVGDLVEFLGENMPLENITPEHLRQWLVRLKKRDARYTQASSSRPRLEGGLSDSTRKGYVRAMKLFFGWLADPDQGYLTYDPAYRIKLPTANPIEKDGIPPEDIHQIVAVARQNADIRATALFLLFRDTGCRLGGVVGMTLDRLDVNKNEVLLLEKGSKERWAFFTDECAEALHAWLKVRPDVKHPYLFTSEKNGQQGQPLQSNGIYRIFESYAKQAGVKKDWNPHQWRHFRIRAWLDAGMSWPVVAQLAGHTLPGVTAKNYSHLTKRRLKDAYFRYTVQKQAEIPSPKKLHL